MDIEQMRGRLMEKSLEELYALRGEQYGSREALVEDILYHDDGCLEEILELEGSQLFVLMGRKR